MLIKARGGKPLNTVWIIQFFYMVVLALLVSLTSHTLPTRVQVAFSINTIYTGVGWVSLQRLSYLCASVH